jgi:hypothetical protein
LTVITKFRVMERISAARTFLVSMSDEDFPPHERIDQRRAHREAMETAPGAVLWLYRGLEKRYHA